MKNIILNDVSLKECLKNESINLTFKEKLDFVKRLCELGLNVIELPYPTEKVEEVLIKTICACTSNAEISISVKNEVEIEGASSILSNAKKSRISINVPVSPVYMEYYTAKKPKAVIEIVKGLTQLASAKKCACEVNFLDATRADFNFLCEAIKTAIEFGAKIIAITDLAGEMAPDEYKQFMFKLFESVPELKNVSVSVQISDDYSMAMASIFSALESGVDEVKVSTISGLGLVDFSVFAKSMEFLATKKGFTCGINKTLVGKTLTRIETILAKRSVFSANANQEQVEISNDISKEDFLATIANNGYELTEEDFEKVYEEFKRIAERKQVYLADLEVIIANVSMQVPETFVLEKFSVNSSNVLQATANIVLTKNGKEISGLSYGNGAVDACFLALENIVGEHFELEGFEIGAVTEGKEAMAQAIVKLRSEGKIYVGRGISTDVIGASIRGYVNTINKIVYERGGAK